MGDLLRRLVASRRGQRDRPGEVPLRYLGRLVRALEREAPGGAAGPSPGGALVSPVARLSERELQVLRLLAAGKQNQEIARELYLALDTVKKHVTHIFEKLGAGNRTEAAARARELGLLP
jgi:LuxR family maltose regulon positive regulatory protein